MKYLSNSDYQENKLTNVPSPIDPSDAANKKYVDDSISSNVRRIAQPSHGFAVGDVLKYSGSTYSKAQADSTSNAEVVGIVAQVIDTNQFILLLGGYISELSGLTANTTYFLSPTTAGALTATEPTDANLVSKPLLRAVSSTSGVFTNMRGMLISNIESDLSEKVTGPSSSINDSPAVFSGTSGKLITGKSYEDFKASLGLSNVDNTSDATKNASVATLTNKTLEAPVINNGSGSSFQASPDASSRATLGPGVTATDMYMTKIGNLAIITGFFSKSSFTTGDVVLSVPPDFIPLVAPIRTVAHGGGVDKSGRIELSSFGSVVVRNTSSSTSSCIFLLVYPTA